MFIYIRDQRLAVPSHSSGILPTPRSELLEDYRETILRLQLGWVFEAAPSQTRPVATHSRERASGENPCQGWYEVQSHDSATHQLNWDFNEGRDAEQYSIKTDSISLIFAYRTFPHASKWRFTHPQVRTRFGSQCIGRYLCGTIVFIEHMASRSTQSETSRCIFAWCDTGTKIDGWTGAGHNVELLIVRPRTTRDGKPWWIPERTSRTDNIFFVRCDSRHVVWKKSIDGERHRKDRKSFLYIAVQGLKS